MCICRRKKLFRTGITIYYPYNGTAPTRASGNGISSTVKTYGNTEFTSGNFKYKINDGSNTVTLISIAAEKLSGDITVPQTVSDGAKTYTVTAVGDAFKNQGTKTAEMTSLVLPDTITSFTGTATFYGCKFTSIHLPLNLVSDGSSKDYPNCLYNTFQWCSNLKSVELPAKITKCFGTFKNSAVKEVTITGKSAVDFYCSSTTVGARAWNDNTTGITINYPADGTAPTRTSGNGISATVKKIGEVVEETVSQFEAGDFAYKVVEGTETVSVTGFSSSSDKSGAKVLPQTVTYKDVTYTVISVGYVAFANQTGLTSFVMADSVTTVGQNVFYGCKNLNFVHLSENLTNAAASYQLVGTF